jgi:hypothetical protein
MAKRYRTAYHLRKWWGIENLSLLALTEGMDDYIAGDPEV